MYVTGITGLPVLPDRRYRVTRSTTVVAFAGADFSQSLYLISESLKCKAIVDGEQKKAVTKPSFAAVPTYPLNFNDMLLARSQKVAFVQFDRQGIQSRIDLL